jgi:prepilin-type N-terminal cleavage/methylation domain-containing protein/prepilin-type processing-associated H-X9-DG protein
MHRPIHGAAHEKAHAFTLIELLVTIVIIAVLASLSLAAINAVRAQGDSARCTSNLRELSAAALAYVSENNGQYVAAQEPTNRVRWHGVRGSTSGQFDPTRGPLAPFLGHNGRVKLCPALVRVLKGKQSFEDGTGGYGYNAAYIGGTPADSFKSERLANVPAPARVVMFADCAFPRAGGLQEYAYAEPWQSVDMTGRLNGPLAPSVHFRHNGNANVAWCDGHITSEKPTKIGARNSYGGDASKWAIGWFGPSDDNGWWNPQRTAR